MSEIFRVLKLNGELAIPKHKYGDFISISGSKEVMINGVNWEEGTQQFTYWLIGVGHDIPEDEII